VDSRASVVSHSLPSLDAGFRHPCRKDGPPTLVYNDERSRVGMQPLSLLRFDTSDAGASLEPFPRRVLIVTQVRASRNCRHFGRDAENQDMDGNQKVVQVPDSGNMPYRSFMFAVAGAHLSWPRVCHPWTLDFGIPAEKTGLQHFCITTSAERGNDTNAGCRQRRSNENNKSWRQDDEKKSIRGTQRRF